jgi:hypothetical protein
MARHYENWLDGYLDYTKDTEAPEAFHWWTGIATIASAMRRNVYIDMRSFEWVPNFYICLVGPAGLVTKSTSLRLGEKLLRGLGKTVKFGSQSGSWQAMAGEIAESASSSWGGYTTCSISYFVSEFGTFFDPTNREQIDFFVDAWDGQKTGFTRNTKSSGKMEIQCPCVNILAATTPTWIKENFSATMIGGGFASRLIFVRGHAKRKFIAYPGLMPQADQFLEKQERLVTDLKHISKLEGIAKLSPEAVAWGENWYKDHYTKKRQFSGERFDGFYARKQTHMHKLALIFSVAESDRLVIEERHLMMANDCLLLVERDLGGVIDNITGKQVATMHKREILSVITAEHEIGREEVYADLYQMMSGADFDKAIADLSKAGKIEMVQRQAKTILRLPQRLHVVKK